MGSNPIVVEITNILVVESLFPATQPLPLTDLFVFNLFFFHLLNLLFYNTFLIFFIAFLRLFLGD